MMKAHAQKIAPSRAGASEKCMVARSFAPFTAARNTGKISGAAAFFAWCDTAVYDSSYA
jgi:hypothetical protein